MPSEETKILEYLLQYAWMPMVGWFMAAFRLNKQDNKDRDQEINTLKEKTAVINATRMSREDVVDIIDSRFEKIDSKIDKWAESVDKKIDNLSNQMTDLIRTTPKRSGDE